MVSVIIATKNREESLKKCLRALYNNNLRGVEILVVDSGDRDNSALFSRGKKVKYFHFESESLAEARDFGWRKARGEIVVFMDADCVAPSDWLSRIG